MDFILGVVQIDRLHPRLHLMVAWKMLIVTCLDGKKDVNVSLQSGVSLSARDLFKIRFSAKTVEMESVGVVCFK